MFNFYKLKNNWLKKVKKLNNLRFKAHISEKDKSYIHYFKDVWINNKAWKNNKLFISKFKNNKFKFKDLIIKKYIDSLNFKCESNDKLNFFDFFFLILKKMKFEKFNNTLGLYNKWSRAKLYLNIFKKIFKIKNKSSFFFLFQVFISLTKMVKKLIVKKNFRDGIYYSLYNLLGKYFFFRPLKIVIKYIKYILNLINDKIDYKKISFYFNFMSNLNVTANLISFYLAMKFKKGFNLFGAINPLKNELARLNFKNKQNKNPYTLYNYKLLFRVKVKKYKKILMKTLAYLKSLFKYNLYKNYLNISSLCFYNIFMYHKNIKYFIFKQFIKIFYICIYYKIFIIFNKILIKNKVIFNNILLNAFNIFNYMPY